MPLTDQEVAFMNEGGTGLRQLPDKEPVKRRRLLPLLNVGRPVSTTAGHDYKLTTDCGYLETTPEGSSSCTAHEDPGRPEVCVEFAEDSYGCRVVRVAAHVDTMLDLELFLERTAGG
jgi:hypothetical protein